MFEYHIYKAVCEISKKAQNLKKLKNFTRPKKIFRVEILRDYFNRSIKQSTLNNMAVNNLWNSHFKIPIFSSPDLILLWSRFRAKESGQTKVLKIALWILQEEKEVWKPYYRNKKVPTFFPRRCLRTQAKIIKYRGKNVGTFLLRQYLEQCVWNFKRNKNYSKFHKLIKYFLPSRNFKKNLVSSTSVLNNMSLKKLQNSLFEISAIPTPNLILLLSWLRSEVLG